MNRGEWGEPYAALRLLADVKLYMADENGNVNSREWMDVLKIRRKETADRFVTYNILSDEEFIEIEINGERVDSISKMDFLQTAERLKMDIVGSTGRSFVVSSEVMDFLSRAEIKHLKAKSVEKSDIFLDARDPRSSIIREDIGFSIKSEFGENPTLFNTGKASAAKYRITGNMTPQFMEIINSIVDNKNHAAVSERCRALRNFGCNLEYVGFEMAGRARCKAFEENLELLNPLLPIVIERMMRNHFWEGNRDVNISDVVRKIVEDNPCNLTRGSDKYPYMVKSFLYAAYCGMTAGTVWDGKSTVKGGYITVRETGEIVANYAMESEAFKSFLYSHCYLDYPSTDAGHGDYGEVYFENGNYYFKLNFQIRIR